ncbi:hypothetical protein C8R44DRAFT_894425 [Mycena epipterygia]|nr:hypothetical protein C8R44DRAFT_894425 [Mycena epipterygia]
MSDFEWNTPSRRAGSRPLSPIPVELYHEIFKYLQPSEELSAPDSKRVFSKLAPVCRFFCAVSISRIYTSLEFSGTDASPGFASLCRLLTKGANANANASGQTLASNNRFAVEVAKLVTNCTFKDWTSISCASLYLKRYSEAISQMPNIESFHLESTPITTPLLRAITKLRTPTKIPCIRTTLTTLSIRSCTFDPDITEKDLGDLSSLKLSNFEYFATSSMLLPPARIHVRQLEIFRTDSWAFSDHFVKRKHPILRILELDAVEDLPALFALLAKCPSITELTIHSIFLKSPDPIPSLPAPALPNIHAIKIPPSLLPYFPKRPLRKVSLVGVETRHLPGSLRYNPVLPLLTKKDISPAMHLAASITELHIHEHICFAFPLHKHFQHLEVLVLSYNHPNFSTAITISSAELFRGAIRSICAKWSESPSPPLREFHLDFGETATADGRAFMWDLQLQLDVISSHLCQTFPHLTAVSFARFLKWQRWDEYSEWRVFVPHRFRALVREDLVRRKGFTDVGGCLDALDSEYCFDPLRQQLAS